MGKWVQKGGYRKKKMYKTEIHISFCWKYVHGYPKKNSKAPFRGLPASIRYFRII